MPNPHEKSPARSSALDGLRGVAIVLVMLSHHLANFQQGWIGVDIFFVLSGYLITTILIAERREQHFWRIFYVRRITRILPPYILLLLITTLAGQISWQVLWPFLIFSGTNIAILIHQKEVYAGGLTALWSLCVEEHFYLLWPVQVRRCSRRVLVLTMACVVALEPIARGVATLHGLTWMPVYFLTPFRLDGLAMGSLLAMALLHPKARVLVGRAALPVSLAGICAVALTFPRYVLYQSVLFRSVIGYSLLGLTSTAVIAFLVLRPESVLARGVSWTPLVFLGRISYSLYLFHSFIRKEVLLLGHARGIGQDGILIALSLAVSLLFASLSFQHLEKPILAWGRRRAGNYKEELAVNRLSSVS